MKSLYFSHDFDSRTDIKIRNLIRKHGMTGYGIYWAIVEDLYRNANAMRTHYDLYAFEMRVEEDVVRSIINDFDLFKINGDTFSSDSVERRISEINDRSNKAATSAKARWDKGESERNANAMRTHSDGNANKNKIENKINTTTTTTTDGTAEEVEVVDNIDFEIHDYFRANVPPGAVATKEASTFIQLNELKNWGAAGGRQNWRKVADLYIRKIKVNHKNGNHGNNGTNLSKVESASNTLRKWAERKGINGQK